MSGLRLRAAAACALAGLAGCGSLLGPPPPAPHFWTLDSAPGGAGSVPGSAVSASGAASAAARPMPAPIPSAAASSPVIVVGKPRAAAGFDTDRMVYVREPHRLEPYADNQWVDTPSRMLEPLIDEALARSGAFGAVLATPSPASGGWQLDTEIVRLQHEVAAARVRFTLRATLVDRPDRTVVAAREFDAIVPTSSADAPGAAAAANAAVADVLAQLADWCAASVRASRSRGPALSLVATALRQGAGWGACLRAVRRTTMTAPGQNAAMSPKPATLALALAG